MRRILLAAALATAGAALAPAPAPAQDQWPSRPITILGGFPNSAGTDIYARKLAQPLSRALGQPVVVDNRTGAGGNIASDIVAKARPDGYTFLLGTAGTHAINAGLYRNLPFDPLQDVTHIILLGDVPNVLLVNPAKRPKFTNCQELMAAARAQPGVLNCSSTGNGASTHLAGAQFAAVTGLDIVHVPYRGQPGAMAALLSGDVDMFFNQSGPSIGAVRQEQVRALAVTTKAPVQALPTVPTVEQACGLPGFDSSTWYGLFAPPGLPQSIQTRMNAEVARIIGTPDFRQWLIETQGVTPPTDLTPEGFRRTHVADIARWAEIIEKSGARVD
jgi:tripartite-type tricarboxylate transporter receptor subunit TctC